MQLKFYGNTCLFQNIIQIIYNIKNYSLVFNWQSQSCSRHRFLLRMRRLRVLDLYSQRKNWTLIVQGMYTVSLKSRVNPILTRYLNLWSYYNWIISRSYSVLTIPCPLLLNTTTYLVLTQSCFRLNSFTSNIPLLRCTVCHKPPSTAFKNTWHDMSHI